MAKYNNIKAELARRGLSINNLAEYMGMSTANIRNKLNGKTKIFLSELCAIQDFFEQDHGERFSLEYLSEEYK